MVEGIGEGVFSHTPPPKKSSFWIGQLIGCRYSTTCSQIDTSRTFTCPCCHSPPTPKEKIKQSTFYCSVTFQMWQHRSSSSRWKRTTLWGWMGKLSLSPLGGTTTAMKHQLSSFLSDYPEIWSILRRLERLSQVAAAFIVRVTPQTLRHRNGQPEHQQLLETFLTHFLLESFGALHAVPFECKKKKKTFRWCWDVRLVRDAFGRIMTGD